MKVRGGKADLEAFGARAYSSLKMADPREKPELIPPKQSSTFSGRFSQSIAKYPALRPFKENTLFRFVIVLSVSLLTNSNGMWEEGAREGRGKPTVEPVAGSESSECPVDTCLIWGLTTGLGLLFG